MAREENLVKFEHAVPDVGLCVRTDIPRTDGQTDTSRSSQYSVSLYGERGVKITRAVSEFSVPVPVLIPSVVTPRPTAASRPSNPLNPSPLAPQIRLLLTIVRVYKLYLLTLRYVTYLLQFFRQPYSRITTMC